MVKKKVKYRKKGRPEDEDVYEQLKNKKRYTELEKVNWEEELSELDSPSDSETAETGEEGEF